MSRDQYLAFDVGSCCFRLPSCGRLSSSRWVVSDIQIVRTMFGSLHPGGCYGGMIWYNLCAGQINFQVLGALRAVPNIDEW